MDQAQAVKDVMLGASLRDVAAAYRQSLIEAFQFRPEEVSRTTMLEETMVFMKKLCRLLGDKHQGVPRIGQALREWVMLVDHYEAYDALLSGFEFEDKETVIRRGRMLFPGTLTAHWTADE